MIRAITLGVPDINQSPDVIESAIMQFNTISNKWLLEQQWSLRTSRLTLATLRQQHEDEAWALPAQLASVSKIADRAGIRWFCLPIDLVHGMHYDQRLEAAYASLFKQSKMFLNLMVADRGEISINASHDAARFMLNVARKSNNGFDNFRVGASCCCLPNAPFFPFSRHEGENYKFSFALETTEIALKLSKYVQNGKILLNDFSDFLVERLISRMNEIDEFGKSLESETGFEYAGLDASFAPYPDGKVSVGALLQQLGARPGGSQGSLFITSILTNAIKKAAKLSDARLTGFNGVMFSVLEDDALASTNNRRMLSIDTLNAWSTVCGCGLDMIPIPGSTLAEDISAIILDTSALSVRLKKPLGVRLLPIPGKEANEFTEFNFDFLCNSRVMQIEKNDVCLPSINGRWVY